MKQLHMKQLQIVFNEVFIKESMWNEGVYYLMDKHGFSLSSGCWTNLKRCRQQARRVSRRLSYSFDPIINVNIYNRTTCAAS